MYSPDGLCAISERCDSLSSTNAIYLMYATQISSYKRCRIDRSVGTRRCTDNDTWYSCNAGWSRKHIHHGWKRAFPSRHIKPNRCYWRDLLSSHDTGFDLCEPLLVRHLPFMERANVANCVFNGLTY